MKFLNREHCDADDADRFIECEDCGEIKNQDEDCDVCWLYEVAEEFTMERIERLERSIAEYKTAHKLMIAKNAVRK